MSHGEVLKVSLRSPYSGNHCYDVSNSPNNLHLYRNQIRLIYQYSKMAPIGGFRLEMQIDEASFVSQILKEA